MTIAQAGLPTTQRDSERPQRFWLLGGMRAIGPAGPISLPGGRVRSLLAYLLLHPRVPHPREVLAELLWPDSSPGDARRSLTSLLYILRRAVGHQIIAATPETLSLYPDSVVWVDVWEFERLVALPDTTALQQATGLYSGDLLPELYADWLAVPRATLREHYLAALLRLANAETERSPANAVEYYRTLLAYDPLHEEARRGLMHCLARLGRRHEALAVYTDLAATLEAELGAYPERITRELADSIGREESHLAHAPRQAEPAFVGRTAERATLIARLEQARSGQGGLASVLGEAGIGKTRLLGELARAAGWRGWQVIWARAPQAAAPAPYAPLPAALAAALPAPRLQQIASGVQPLWLTLLAGLVPSITPSYPSAPLPPDASRWLPVAISHILAALAGVIPHLLILDDLQWADPACWEMLDALRPRLQGVPLLLLICARSEELAPDAWASLVRWDGAGDLCLRLSGLSEGELAELALASGGATLSPPQLTQLSHASGGSPLLALIQLHTGESDLGQSSLNLLFQRRLQILSAPAAAALVAAAALGSRFSYNVWDGVLGPQGGPALAHLALELEHAGLLILEPGGYRFAHDTLRAYLYSRLSPAARRDLHRRALAACPSDDPLAMLHHANEAGDTAAAATAALTAAERALASFALPAARHHFAQALTLLPTDDLARRYQAVRGQLTALSVSNNHTAALECLDLLDSLANQLANLRLQAEVATLRADRCIRSGYVTEAREAAERARRLAAQAGDTGQEARAYELIAQLAQQHGDYRAAQEYMLAARAHYQATGEPRGEATTTHNLAIIAWAIGEHQGAIEGYTHAAACFRQMGDLLNQARALNGLGCALWGVGNYPAAQARHEEALAISCELSDHWGEATATLNLGQVSLATGDFIAAIDRFAAALTGFRALGQQAGIAAALSSLAHAYALLGDRAAALSYAAESLRVSQAAGLLRIEGYAQHNRGLALLDWSGKTSSHEAAESLRAACYIRERLGERENLAESRACLALILAAGHPMEAQQVAAAADTNLAESADRAGLRQLIAYAAAVAARAADDMPAAKAHLRVAAEVMRAAAAALPESERQRFLQQVPLNRATQAALDTLSHQINVRIVRADVPLGRSLTSDDYRSIRWTVASPDDAAIAHAADRRRYIIHRLISEATAQGVAPTDTDLAQALGVSRRTILRDIEHLALTGVNILTRRRR